MEQLDEIVVSELESRISRPDRIKALLAGLIERQRNRGDEQAHRSKELRQQLRETKSKIRPGARRDPRRFSPRDGSGSRPVDKIGAGANEVLRLIASLDRRRLASHAVIREERQGFRACIQRSPEFPDGSLRKAYIRELVNKVEVGQKEIRISGSEAALAPVFLRQRTGATPQCPVSCRVGGRTRARTWDPLIKSQLLYQLSYAPGPHTWGSPKPAGLSNSTPHCPAIKPVCEQQVKKPPGGPGGYLRRRTVRGETGRRNRESGP